MALHTFDPWIPEDWGGSVVQKIMQLSAVESTARIEPMTTKLKHVPRSGGMGIDVLGRGDSYTEDSSTDDEVLLTARKLGRGLSLAEEDLADEATTTNIVDTKKVDWSRAYSIGLDNGTLAVSGAESEAADRPFTSVYQAVRTSDSGLGYTADDNYVSAGDNLGSVTFTDSGDVVTFNQVHGLKVNDRVKVGTVTTTTGITAGTTYYVKTVPSTTTVTLSATQGGSTLALTTDGSAVSCTKLAVTYLSLSRAVGLYETSDWFDATDSFVIASPAYKRYCRDMLDLNGQPVLVKGGDNQGDSLFGYPVKWSLGARVSTALSAAPSGNPLLVIGNRQLLILGRRSGPESFIDTSAGFSTDEVKLKIRARRAFAAGHPAGFAVYEAV
jgi:hypothetical protein